MLKYVYGTDCISSWTGWAVAKARILLLVGLVYVGGRHLVRIMQRRRPTIDVKDMIAGAAERKEIYKEFRLFEAE